MEAMNDNRVLLGCAALLANIGGKYIALELNQSCKNLLSRPIVRKLVIFSILFIMTRDIKFSIMLTVGFIVVTKGFMYMSDDDDNDTCEEEVSFVD